MACNFPRCFFPEFSSGTPEQIPATATAFSSLLMRIQGVVAGKFKKASRIWRSSQYCAHWGHCKEKRVYKGYTVFVKIGDFIKFKGFLVEFLENRRS